MSSRPIAAVLRAPRPWGGLLLLSAPALWLTAMGPRLVSWMLFGPICSGHGSAFAWHCPPCYAALALAILGSSLFILPSPRSH